MNDSISDDNLYPYSPIRVLPIIFACIVGLSLALHFWQNFRYSYWRITFFIIYGALLYTAGWAARAASTYRVRDIGLYIAQMVDILAAAPFYAAVQYNILLRLTEYLPMHAVRSPRRVYLWYYLGGIAVLLALLGNGIGQAATVPFGSENYVTGGVLMGISHILQAGIEINVVAMVAIIHWRCIRAGTLAPNVRMICYTLYGTSALMLIRCIFRVVEAFLNYARPCDGSDCGPTIQSEWLLYVFEAAPMVLYTYTLNVFHPGLYLPSHRDRFLDPDGETERMRPERVDSRTRMQKIFDPCNFWVGRCSQEESGQFWLRPQECPACEDGSFALGTGTNVGKSARRDRQRDIEMPADDSSGRERV